jgi:hypothetical protein
MNLNSTIGYDVAIVESRSAIDSIEGTREEGAKWVLRNG